MFVNHLLSIGLLLAVSTQTCTNTDKYFAMPEDTSTRETITDDTRLVDMWIAGTHDSGTKGGSLYGACQDLTLQGQLDAGIRAFDIRLVDTYDGNGRMFVCHGIERFDLELSHDVLPAFTEFLKDQPEEFVVIAFRKEDDPKGKPEYYAAYIESITKALTAPEFDPFVFKGRLSLETAVKELKGKMVLLTRNELTPGFPAGKFSGFPNDGTAECVIIRPGTDIEPMPAFVEDAYKVSNPFGKSDKKSDLKEAIKKASQVSGDAFNIFYLSGTGISSPKKIAETMNPYGIELLGSMATPPAGIYFMDFAGSDAGRGLTKMLLSLNTKKK